MALDRLFVVISDDFPNITIRNTENHYQISQSSGAIRFSLSEIPDLIEALTELAHCKKTDIKEERHINPSCPECEEPLSDEVNDASDAIIRFYRKCEECGIEVSSY